MNVRFNNTFLADLMMRGYRYMIFKRNEDVIEMAPSKTPFSREELELVNMTQLNLSDPTQLLVIESLDLLGDFIFVIDSKHFSNADEHLRPDEQGDSAAGDATCSIKFRKAQENPLCNDLGFKSQ